MPSMAINRRTLLRRTGGVAAGLAAAGTLVAINVATPRPARAVGYVGGCQQPDGRYAVACFDASGIEQLVVPLPGRGHGITTDARTGLIVIFARRPGRFALVLRPDQPPQLFTPPDDRHFYGHGTFSPAGDLLYATENDFHRQQGMIGVYAAADWRRIGEFPTGGVEPHEVVLLPDGVTLAVANGGIATDPAVGDGRTPLGEVIASDLVLLDRRTGAPRGRWRLPESLADLSIRHLAVDRLGSVWFGGQWEGATEVTPPLLGRLRRNGVLESVATAAIDGNLANYVGSVASDAGGRLIAASSPRAGAVVLLDASTARIIDVVTLTDGCGLAGTATPGRFIATSGNGAITALDVTATAASEEPLRTATVRWDNHLHRLQA